MGLFGKSKKKSSCCSFQIEEEPKVKNQKSSCCDIKIEEVEEPKKEKENNNSCGC